MHSQRMSMLMSFQIAEGKENPEWLKPLLDPWMDWMKRGRGRSDIKSTKLKIKAQSLSHPKGMCIILIGRIRE